MSLRIIPKCSKMALAAKPNSAASLPSMSDAPDATTGPAKLLRELVLEALQKKPGLKASDLARALGWERREVNRCLHYDLAGLVQQGNDYRWRLAQRDSQSAPSASAPTSEPEAGGGQTPKAA